MADSVLVNLDPSVSISSVTTEVSGAKTSISIRLPQGGVVNYTHGTGAAQVNATHVNQISLVTSTPQTPDLTGLTGGQGDTSFSKIKVFALFNNEAAGSGKKVIVGNGTNAFVGPFGAAAHTIAVEAGCGLVMWTKETAGWAVANGSTDGLKLDPGANNVSVTLVLAGNS
jgi:hypothetical protein